MSTIPEKYLQTILNAVVSKLGVIDYSYENYHFENIGQNYFGTLIPTNLKCKVEDKIVEYHIVLKLAPLDERYRVSGAVTTMFAREIFIYSEVLGAYEKLQKFFPLPFRYEIPTLYYTCNEYCKESIVMENMCVKGYKPYSNSRFLDLYHIKIALQTLARLHALSMILEEKDKQLFKKIKETCLPLSEQTNRRFMDILMDRLKKAKTKFEGTTYVSLLEILLKNCVQLVENTSTRVKNLCLCHGDIWKENILFKYKDDVPVSACLIDYQTSRICSPGFDVFYLIVSSTDSKLRNACYRQLIDTYYETLTQTLALANISEKYSRTSLDYDLKVVGPACFIIANTALWLSSGLQEEGHVRSKIQWSTEEEKSRAVENYKNIIEDLMNDLTSYGYFQFH